LELQSWEKVKKSLKNYRNNLSINDIFEVPNWNFKDFNSNSDQY